MQMHEKELALSARAATGQIDEETGRLITERLDTLDHAEHMSEKEKQHILKDIARLIGGTSNRILFNRITGQSPRTFFTQVERENGGVLSLRMCLERFNDELEKALTEGTVDRRELVRIQHLKALMSEIVSDLIALHECGESEAYWQTQTDQQKALDEIRTQVDRIADLNRGKPLNHTLSEISAYLHTFLGRKDISEVGIAYVNENNDYLHSDVLTRVHPDQKDPNGYSAEEVNACETYPEKIFSSEGNTSIHDAKKKTHYLGFRLGKQCLGIIDIRFRKANNRLLPEQEALCSNAISILDTYLDNKLKSQRAQRHRRKVERILDRSGTDITYSDGRETGFRQGIIRALSYLCGKTAAKYIRLDLDVMGDLKSFMLEICIGPQGEISTGELDAAKDGLTARSHKITVPPGTVIDDDVKAIHNGTITFFGEDLDEEDQQTLEMTAEKLISAVRNWRNDLNNTINFGLPPQVALLRKKGLLKPRSVEELSMSYTDLHGFTAISERVNEITSKYGLKEDYMMRLIAAYDQLGKDIAVQSGGCYDKLVGDCLIIHAGPPYTIDDRDGLGQTTHNPSHHAINCLKIALRIRNSMPEIQRVYENLLLEMATEIEEKSKYGPRSRSFSGNEPRPASADIDVFCATHNIPRILTVTQGIASGKATIGLVRDENRKADTYSSSYTVIGDEMNIAARLQAQANPDEMVIGKKTKELIEKAIEDNLPVPFNFAGSTQDWEGFKKELLGSEYGEFDLVPMFEETMLALKHKQGYEYAYRLAFEKIARAEKPAPEAICEEDLKLMPGYYKVISSDSKDRKLEVHLENLVCANGILKTTISKPPVETRYVTPADFDRRVKENCDSVLKVKNNRIVLVEYVPVDKVINGKLEDLHKEARIYEPGQVPDGIYTVKRRFTPRPTEDGAYDPDRLVLEVEMNGITLLIQVNSNELLELKDIKDRPKARTLYDIHMYSHTKRMGQIAQNLNGLETDAPDAGEILFIHSSGEFIGNPDSVRNIDTSIPPTLPSAR
jgi:class 3 adenylate cyclase